MQGQSNPQKKFPAYVNKKLQPNKGAEKGGD